MGIYEAAVEFYGLGVGEVMRLNLSLQKRLLVRFEVGGFKKV